MPYPPRFLRHTNYLSFLQAGGIFDQNFASYLDAELNDIASTIDQEVSRWQAVTTASAQLINNASALAMALAGSQRFVATAAQTVYLTTIPWDASFTAQTIIMHRIPAGTTSGGFLDWNGLTVANNGGFLQVTITSGPTIAANDIILIDAFSPGAGVLAQLASITHAQGASLVGIEDVGAYFTSTTVEGALSEFKLAYNTFVTAVGATANLMKRDGSTAMTAALPMGGFKVTGAADGTSNTDLVTVQQLNTATQGVLALTQFFLRADVAVSWQSDQAANSHKLAGLIMTDTLGATASEAANQNYVTGYVAAQLATINSQLAALGNPSAAGKRILSYTTAGSGVGYSWTVPTGVTAALVEIWGAGGVPGASAAASSGAYAQASLTLVAGDVVTFAIGAGGIAAGGDGQDSVCFVNGTEVCRGGGGKQANTRAAGSVSISTKVSGGFTMSGGVGFAAPASDYIHGSAPRGGNGGRAGGPTAGVWPGGASANTVVGAAGGAIITY